MVDEASKSAICGWGKSDGGMCHIRPDHITAKIAYTELIGDGNERLHGWLEQKGITETIWLASLCILEKDEEPWYGPSCGPEPDTVGEVLVTILEKEGDGPRKMQTQIKQDGDDDFGEPVVFAFLEEDA